MDDATRHPDDERLFDYVAGGLDAAAMAVVERHLQRCSACAGFVRAAGAGTDALDGFVEPMPDALATDMHRALAVAWRERRDAIAAHEAALDAAAPVRVAADAVDELDAPTPRPEPHDQIGHPAARPARWRRVAPVLAFVVLATLAGTSIYLGGDQSSVDEARTGGDPATIERDDAPDAVSEDAPVDEGARADSAAGAGAEADSAAGAPASAPADLATAETGTDVDSGVAAKAGAEREATSADDAAFDVPPIGEPGEPGAQVEPVEPVAPTCRVTRDETDLALPDGRLAMSITRGPFGLFLVCG